MTISPVEVPGLVAGKYTIDPAHSEVGFTVRHLMVAKVRGLFTSFSGDIVIGEDPLDSSVTASVDMDSIDTRNPDRNAHLRSADFFEIEKYPTMTYVSTSVEPTSDGFIVHGDLTLKGVSRPVDLTLEYNGTGQDPWGGTRVGFSAETEINRTDFGVNFNLPLADGGIGIGEKVKVVLEVEAVLQP
jgi:polyisoprenoid-binding protein YceI